MIFAKPCNTRSSLFRKSSTITGSMPAATNSTQVWEPIKPAPPVTITFFIAREF
jgi:hypothetical protein